MGNNKSIVKSAQKSRKKSKHQIPLKVHDGILEKEVSQTKQWLSSPRFKEITRLYSSRQVVEQQGTLQMDYPIAGNAARDFYQRLRELFSKRRSITTFGPYSPGQAVTMRRMGIDGIYLGGWATSAKGSTTEDPGPDLASYPLSQVPDEAAVLVRALIAADKNQKYIRSRMTEDERKATPEIDYRPFIIADADTGHGGEAHVRNLIRRFVEAGVPGYHIEDQKPGVKKCGHQAGKVLVPQDEQIKRLNSARFQLDIMRVPGIIVARTDAEAATYLDGRGDERDHSFILGATNVAIPSYKVAYLAILKRFYERGIAEVNGHLLYKVSDVEYDSALKWLQCVRMLPTIDESIEAYKKRKTLNVETVLNKIIVKFLDLWQMEAGLKTYGQAVADVMKFHIDEGSKFDLTIDEWHHFVKNVSFPEAREKAKSMGINIIWDCELSRTPEGYYQIKGGIEFATHRSLEVAPYCDIIWMETKTANLADAKKFADAIHAVYPDKMLAYNLSPSFNWDTTGMTDDGMGKFPRELGKLGFVFNFITYGGHQIDGLVAEEFATALKEDGMLALARIQRKFRLLNSPYKTPQTYVGGPRLDGALMASTGRTATTKAMGKGSTQFQHLVQTELPPKVLESWLEMWTKHYQIQGSLNVKLRPHTAGSDLLELNVLNDSKKKVANVIFATIQDRKDRTLISVRNQNTFLKEFRKKRLMTLIHLFLIHRYKGESVHYVSPTDDNQKQTQGMKKLGIYSDVNIEIGDIIVAVVDSDRVKELLNPNQTELKRLISKSAKRISNK
jgi:isocitrate lyase